MARRPARDPRHARTGRPRRGQRSSAGPAAARAPATEAFEVVIERLASDGAGIARAPDGRIVFVPLTAPGDRIRARATLSKRTFLRAELVEVLTPGPARVDPPCPVFGRCGGCAWQHIDYAAQLRAKAGILADALTRIGGLALTGPIEVVPSPQAYGYRGRARLRVEAGRPGYRQAASDRIEAVSDCPILAAPLRTALGALAARRPDDGEWELALGEPDRRWPDGVRVTKLAASTGASAGASAGASTEFDAGTSAARGDDLQLRAGGETVRIAPGGFAQANPLLFEALVAAVLRAAGCATAVQETGGHETGSRDERLLELFAGAGFFTLPLARRFLQVTAVEAAGSAIANLRAAAAQAGLDNIDAVVDDVGDFVTGHRFRSCSADVVFADPPRAGLGEATVAALCRPGPARLVYLSCDPATLARDLATLTGSSTGAGAGSRWSLQSVQGFDLFPQTPHVEALVVLTRPR